jgi:hypothetical protein
MRYVFGTFPKSTYQPGEPLPYQTRRTFEHWETQAGGYFDLIGPFFEHMAIRQCGIPLQSINVLLVLSKLELIDAVAIADTMLQQFCQLEEKWSHHQGSEKAPGKAERQIYIALYRRRLLAIVNWLRRVFVRAIDAEHCVVFGNGVCYRMLCGIKLPPGTMTYS